jgi:carboxypeptidase family protein
MRRFVAGFALAGTLVWVPVVAWAQANSGIAGVVRDTSGAVLPGVTVEASSPALIEKVRTVTTDSQGRYNIVDLRPGVYAVTFSLTGFSTVRREGIELTAAFTAPVSVEMRIGALEETITVSTAAPVVDTQNVIKRQVVSSEVINTMPTSKNWSTIGIMTVGVFSNQNDVGGSAGEHQNQLKAHGGSFNDRLVQMDGLMISNMACNYSCVGVSTNDASTQELSYEFGAISAETGGGGVRVNIIPKEGGNSFSGSAFANFANNKMQWANLDDDLMARGVTSTDAVDYLYDTSFAFGGPIKKDKLWFWSAHRYWGYSIFRTGVYYDVNPFDFRYDADFSRPGTDSQPNTSNDIRLTWQMSPRNKLSGYYSYAPRSTNHWIVSNTRQPEASNLQRVPLNHFETLTFKSTLTSKMLLDLGFGNTSETWTREPVRDAPSSRMIPVTEQLTGVNFRAYSGTFSENYTAVRSYRGSLSYVPGSHAVKAGFTLVNGPADTHVWTDHDMSITVRNGAPQQVTVRTTPYTTRERLVADLGLYVQDTWTVNRFTVNAGLRFDYLNNKIAEQDAPGGTWIGPRHFDAMKNVPNWKDLGPRLGVAYDVFGNGKTAVKATLSRYVATSTVGFARGINPLNTTVNNANRNWSDTNNDGIPQVSEMGPLTSTFGQLIVSTTYDPDVVTGWFKRRNNWEVSASVTQEIMAKVSADVAYYRRTQGNFTATDNTEIGPADYDTYCVTAPVDSRLPTSGRKICGLYDLKIEKAIPSLSDAQVVTFADKFGKRVQMFNGIDVTVNARPTSRLLVNGGFAVGEDTEDDCDQIVDSPQKRFCHTETGWLTQIKASASYTLPWYDFQFGAVFQNLPGQQITASWSVTAAQAEGLGRAFSGTSTRTIQLIEPGTLYGDRRSQLDLRLSKTVRVGGGRRLQLMADMYNAFNSNAPVGATSQAGETPPALNTTYSSADPTKPGGAWLTPLNILQGRYVKFGAQLNF